MKFNFHPGSTYYLITKTQMTNVRSSVCISTEQLHCTNLPLPDQFCPWASSGTEWGHRARGKETCSRLISSLRAVSGQIKNLATNPAHRPQYLRFDHPHPPLITTSLTACLPLFFCLRFMFLSWVSVISTFKQAALSTVSCVSFLVPVKLLKEIMEALCSVWANVIGLLMLL